MAMATALVILLEILLAVRVSFARVMAVYVSDRILYGRHIYLTRDHLAMQSRNNG